MALLFLLQPTEAAFRNPERTFDRREAWTQYWWLTTTTRCAA